MELSEVLRQVLELDDDGSDWNVSEDDDEIDECDDMPTETTTLDPLDAAQLERLCACWATRATIWCFYE